MHKIKVAGYVKLAKLWNTNKNKALIYHNEYYKNKYSEINDFELINVYVDITGKKEIYKRPEMIKLLNDCINGKVDCIATQTKAYLAPNILEMCFLLLFLLDANIDIITEDEIYNINTLINEDNQKQELYNMAQKYVSINSYEYKSWNNKIYKAIEHINYN